jgi:hypothetical protein
LPRFSLCDGPRTEAAEFTGITWPHKPIEQVTDCDEALFDGRYRSLPAELLDMGCNMQRLHAGNRRDAGVLAPCQEFPRGLGVGAAGVPVADVGGEEFPKARLGARATDGDKRGGGADPVGTSWFMRSICNRGPRRARRGPDGIERKIHARSEQRRRSTRRRFAIDVDQCRDRSRSAGVPCHRQRHKFPESLHTSSPRLLLVSPSKSPVR